MNIPHQIVGPEGVNREVARDDFAESAKNMLPQRISEKGIVGMIVLVVEVQSLLQSSNLLPLPRDIEVSVEVPATPILRSLNMLKQPRIIVFDQCVQLIKILQTLQIRLHLVVHCHHDRLRQMDAHACC